MAEKRVWHLKLSLYIDPTSSPMINMEQDEDVEMDHLVEPILGSIAEGLRDTFGPNITDGTDQMEHRPTPEDPGRYVSISGWNKWTLDITPVIIDDSMVEIN